MEQQPILMEQRVTHAFWFSFLQSLLLVFLSEFSESNFIIIIVSNLKTKSEVVFISSLLSLLFIHSVSLCIGCFLCFVLRERLVEALSLGVLFLTGAVIIVKALIRKSKTIEDEMIVKLKEEINETIELEAHQEEVNRESSKKLFTKQLTIIDECHTEETKGNDSLREPLLKPVKSKFQKKLSGKEIIQYERQFSFKKQRQQWSYSEITNLILTVILNEIGKPTQMVIIAIAALCSISGLVFGASISLFLITVLACCSGETVSQYVTSRTIMFITGFSFIALGVEVIYA